MEKPPAPVVSIFLANESAAPAANPSSNSLISSSAPSSTPLPLQYYSWLQEMKPKYCSEARPFREPAEKLREVLSMYDQTREVLENAQLEIRLSGASSAYGMTLSDIDDKLSEVLAEKMQLADYLESQPVPIHDSHGWSPDGGHAGNSNSRGTSDWDPWIPRTDRSTDRRLTPYDVFDREPGSTSGPFGDAHARNRRRAPVI